MRSELAGEQVAVVALEVDVTKQVTSVYTSTARHLIT